MLSLRPAPSFSLRFSDARVEGGEAEGGEAEDASY